MLFEGRFRLESAASASLVTTHQQRLGIPETQTPQARDDRTFDPRYNMAVLRHRARQRHGFILRSNLARHSQGIPTGIPERIQLLHQPLQLRDGCEMLRAQEELLILTGSLWKQASTPWMRHVFAPLTPLREVVQRSLGTVLSPSGQRLPICPPCADALDAKQDMKQRSIEESIRRVKSRESRQVSRDLRFQ